MPYNLLETTAMLTAPSQTLAREDGLRFTLERDARAMTVAEVIAAWRHDAEFRLFWNKLLAGTSYSAFRWETPAVTSSTLRQPFEFVVLNSPGLDRPPEAEAFAEHFHDPAATVTSFANLRGDAILVVPYPVTAPQAYVHLATFVRSAPDAQQQAFWQAVGEAMTERVGVKPVWLSTAGAGVAWLHVRLDDRPKYYSYTPYRQTTRV